MTPDRAIGLWKSSFGPVKIAYDTATPGQVEGVWLYQRQGQDVIGYFHGSLSGNVLTFNWSEPQTGAPLVGGGFLEFSTDGKTFAGKWWTQNRDRGGSWNGWRADNAAQPPVPGTNPLPPAPQPTQPWPGDQPPPASPTPEPQPPTWNPNPPPPNTPTRGDAEQAPNPPPAHI